MAKKILEGIVVKAGHKTIRVETETMVKHPIYSKVVKRRKCILSHDESGIAKVGDKVVVEETRPISAKKSFILKNVLGK